MSEEEEKRLKKAFSEVVLAEIHLQKATRELAKFGENVVSMNAEATKITLEMIKSIDMSMGFIKSFVRVGVLQQVVKKTPLDALKEANERNKSAKR